MAPVNNLQAEALRELENIAGLRLNTEIRERRLYNHDVGELPGLARVLIGDALPQAVVQPETEEGIIEVVKWAKKYNVPLVPRAAATSGYGGVVPVKGGVVLELVHYKNIIEIDREKELVTVEAGMVWQELEEKLAAYDLSLRLMPSSAPGSTVGGWLAQGGGGIGSYRYGWFEENVVAARVVTIDGEVKNLTGEELQLVSGAMGTTGIVTSITLRVKKKEDEVVFGIRAKSAGQLQTILNSITKEKLPLWHVGFINPDTVEMKNQLPPKEHHGHLAKRSLLPSGYILLLVTSLDEAQTVKDKLTAIIEASGAEFLPQDLTRHEWEERFKPMKIKRIGPSLVPAEVVVPLNNLGATLADFEQLIKLPFAIEGTVVKGEEVILLGFIPHDVRRFSFNFAYALSLSVLKIACRHGGRAYASGLYLAKEARQIHGTRFSRWIEYKAQKDPADLLNPGKLNGKPNFKALITMANTFEPIARFLANNSRPPLKEEYQEKNGLPGEVVWYAYSCSQCGYCRNVCTLYDGKGWESSSPRGKWSFLRLVAEGKEKFDQPMTNNFLMCTTCERCDFNCQLDLPTEPSWAVMRGELVNSGKQMTFPAFEIMAASLKKEKNIWANLSKDRAQWLPEEIEPKIKDKAEIAYFAGCTASFVEKDIAQGAVKLLDAAGVEFTYLGEEEACCGIPMLVAGRWDVFEEILRHNIAAMKKRGVKTVVTSCPACWLSWHTYYPEWAQKLGLDFSFETKHYSEVITEKIAEGKFSFQEPVDMKLTFHDSCHIGRAGGIYEPPRELLKALPGVELVEMEHNREDALCCGSVLTRISEPDPTANKLGGKRIEEALATGADAVVALCPCCQFQLRVAADSNGQEMEVKDLAALAAKGLGIELPDPTPYALEMWAVFDKMINLMQIPNMTEMMVPLLPNMVEAMPSSLKNMMVLVKVPGFDAVMKPIMPKMMPLLMPSIMPKVMPAILKEVEKRVPMPDFMKEQMPDLLPKVMENMMPHILPEIAPKITPVMIEYLKTGKMPEQKTFVA